MDKFVIHGGRPLRGEIRIAGAKNAALPLMAAALLSREPLSLQHVPQLGDVRTMARLLAGMGVDVTTNDSTMQLTARDIREAFAPYEMVKTMRASILCLGPLVARCGEARVSLPGGCAIGTRPVDQHLRGLEAMGATVNLEQGYIHATAKKLRGARLTTDMPTVTGTENLMMAACLAEGESCLENAAREPEVVNLAQGLQAMGARIEGAGTDTILVQGVSSLHGATCQVIADRIEAGTYLCAAAATGGSIKVLGVIPNLLDSLQEKLRAGGCEVHSDAQGISLAADQPLKAIDASTAPYPGFPTDLQAQYMALCCVAQGVAVLKETIFENRFQHVLELVRLGANIQIDGRTAVVQGANALMGTTVMATDLRASAGLVIAGLAAQGETHIERIYHLDRGYERMEEKLNALGAQVSRVKAS